MIFYPWFPALMLAMESSNVIQFRIRKIAEGGEGALNEASLMIREKIGAHVEAAATLAGGGTAEQVIQRYREQVAANAARLSSVQ